MKPCAVTTSAGFHPRTTPAWLAAIASAVCLESCHAAAGADLPPPVSAPAAPAPAIYLAPENPAELLQVDSEMRRFFDPHVSTRPPSAAALQEIVGAIVRAEGLAFTYEGLGTFDAGETFRRRRGNCLSFSLLVTAVARAYGFKTTFWQVAQPERWNRVGDIIASLQHVNVRVETDDGPYIVDLRPDLVSANGGRVATQFTDQRAAAYFYSDVGFVHLVEGRTAEARQSMVTATQVDPQSASAWSNRATLHLRLGELAAARSCYERSLQIDRRGLNVLVGLVSVLKRLGTPEDLRLAHELERRAQKLMDRNPYYHQHLARIASERADWQTAEKELRRAIDLKADEPEFYEQWIASLQQLGRGDAAKRAAAKLEKLRAHLESQSARIVP